MTSTIRLSLTPLDLPLSQLVLGLLLRVSGVLEEDSFCSQSDRAEQEHPSVPLLPSTFPLPPGARMRECHGHTQYQAMETVGSNQPVFILSWY